LGRPFLKTWVKVLKEKAWKNTRLPGQSKWMSRAIQIGACKKIPHTMSWTKGMKKPPEDPDLVLDIIEHKEEFLRQNFG
jgi:hypothetical protein